MSYKSNLQVKNNSFFFFVDFKKETDIKIFNVNKFFWNIALLSPTKYFLIFPINKIDFNLLEKNDKLFFFMIFFGKIFFKDQLKFLKILLNIEKKLINNDFFNINLLKNKFYLNFFFFFDICIASFLYWKIFL